MLQKIIQIGNSQGVIIPTDELKKIGAKKGDKVKVEIRKADSKKNDITPEFLDWLEKFNKKYGDSLQELAEK